MSLQDIPHISDLSHIDIAALDNTSFYDTFDKLWKIIKSSIYPDPNGKPLGALLDLHKKFLAEMDLPHRRENPDQLFSLVWALLKSPMSTDPTERPIRDFDPIHQKFLTDMMSRNELQKPAAALTDMLATIKFFHNTTHTRKPFPTQAVLTTFEMLIDAATPDIRRSVFLNNGESISQVHPKLFERLSVQVVKEKLLAQKEIQEGLQHAPAQSKM